MLEKSRRRSGSLQLLRLHHSPRRRDCPRWDKAKRPLAAAAAGPPKRTKVTADAKKAGTMDVEEEAEADASADAKVEYLDEYDPYAEDSFIEALLRKASMNRTTSPQPTR